MPTSGKKFQAAALQVEARPYSLPDAVGLVQKIKYAKFDETVELSVRLGVDPKQSDQQVVKHNRFDVGIYFPDDYLRQASTYQVLTWLDPINVFHPNIAVPHICVGEQFLRPGTPLVEILYQVYAVITYRKWASHRGLNADACQWAINHQELFPSDQRPLKRRALKLEIELTNTRGRGS